MISRSDPTIVIPRTFKKTSNDLKMTIVKGKNMSIWLI
jgi:hypothetical protein